LLPQEWLIDALNRGDGEAHTYDGDPGRYRLLAHCTERTNEPTSAALWREVFARAGLSLISPASGCCGMSGTYGHESRNVATSKAIFEQSWARHVDEWVSAGETRPQKESSSELLATGYSCRCQTTRLRGRRLRHPIEALLDTLRAQGRG
jgi:Fe-S oxidoreductase